MDCQAEPFKACWVVEQLINGPGIGIDFSLARKYDRIAFSQVFKFWHMGWAVNDHRGQIVTQGSQRPQADIARESKQIVGPMDFMGRIYQVKVIRDVLNCFTLATIQPPGAPSGTPSRQR